MIRVPNSDAPPELASLLLDIPVCIYLSALGCLQGKHSPASKSDTKRSTPMALLAYCRHEPAI